MLLLLFFSAFSPIGFAQYQYPVSPIAIGGPTAYLMEVSMDSKVDEIEEVEAMPNQLIVQTTKVGPVESLKVSVGLVEIATGNTLPPYNMSGFLLVFARGRYTLGGLKSNTWYGLSFNSEQLANGEPYRHSEQRLIKTSEENAQEPDKEDMFTVNVTPKKDEVDVRLITVKWLVDYEKRKNFYVIVNLTMVCDDSTKFKQYKLLDQQDEHDVPVKLDTSTQLLPVKTNQIFASVVPRLCHVICWATILGAEAHKNLYEKPSIKQCVPIETVNVTTSIRKYLGYEYVDDKLTVHTNISKNANENNSSIEMVIIDLKDMTGRKENFSIERGQTDFHMEHLDPTNWYIGEYKYHRSAPFPYWEIERFTVEPKETNENHGPVQMFFGYQALKEEENGTSRIRVPKAKFVMSPNFKTISSVGIDTDPFCNSTDQHFWLTKDEPEKELNSSDLISSVCAKNTNFLLCKHEKDRLSKCANSKFCYRGNIVLSGRVYKMKRRCVDVAAQFSNMRKHTNTTETKSSAQEEDQEANKSTNIYSIFPLFYILSSYSSLFAK